MYPPVSPTALAATSSDSESDRILITRLPSLITCLRIGIRLRSHGYGTGTMKMYRRQNSVWVHPLFSTRRPTCLHYRGALAPRRGSLTRFARVSIFHQLHSSTRIGLRPLY